MNRRIHLLCAAALSLSLLAGCASTSNTEDTTPASKKNNDIAILYTNDIHTYIDGPLSYDIVAALKEDLSDIYAHVLLVDAGDHAQGTAYGSMDQGSSIIQMMNAADYDVATLGNHEFDYGMFGCMKLIDNANYPYISANFYHETNGVRKDNVLDSYMLFEFENETIAFIGMTTPESFSKSTPAYFQDEQGNFIYGISGGADGDKLISDIQNAIDDATEAGATTIIGLGHLGIDPSSKAWTSSNVISNLSGLDAFIDGHSHSVVEGEMITDKSGNNVLLTQTGEYFNRIGLMVIDGDNGKITSDFIEYTPIENQVMNPDGSEVLDDYGEPVFETVGYKLTCDLHPDLSWRSDPEVAELKNAWMNEIDDKLGTTIGTSLVTLDNYNGDQRLVRKQETNTGDFSADAIYYLFDNMGLDVDVAVVNGGGIRNNAIHGNISYKECKEIHTFGNVACLQTVTGQQLLDALEWGARSAGTLEENGSFLHVSGITYKINTLLDDSTQTNENNIWIGGPTNGYRVYDVMVYSKETDTYEPLDLNAAYNLAGHNYILRDLGGGFNMFDGAVNILDYVMEDYMVLGFYIQAFENGIIDATNSPLLAKYPGMLLDYTDVYGSGRIEIVTE